MKSYYSKISLLLVFTVLSVIQGFSQTTLENIVNSDTLRVGMSLDQPPFCMKDQDGSPKGFDVDLAELLAESMGVKLKIVVMEFPELLNGLNSGYCDVVISGLTITPRRNIEANFAGPYMYSGKAILAYKNKFAKLNEAKLNKPSVTLVALSNSTSQSYIDRYFQKANAIYVDSYEQAVAMMQTNKADALVTDRSVIEVLNDKYPKEHFKYSENELLTVEPIGMAVGRDDAQFLNLLENYIATLENLGYLNALEVKWFAYSAWTNYIEK